jgi:catechol 2,3-dioxygenase-like lactoylglutathione lyase family enzyme
MAFHHVALATRDPEANHRFYTEAMGFELAKVVAGKTPEGGWSKHLFYRTGDDELIAFWDLHDESLPADWSSAISTGLGLPGWVNHIAFQAQGLGDLEARKRRWLACGHDVTEVDHGWCRSIYTMDPNGVLVEFCTTTRALGEADRAEAERLLRDPHPPLESGAEVSFHRAPKRP